MSRLPQTAGRPVGEVLDEILDALQRIKPVAGGEETAASDALQSIDATLRHIGDVLDDVEERAHELPSEEAEKLRVLRRLRRRFGDWHARLALKLKEAERLEAAQRREAAEVARQLDAQESKQLVGCMEDVLEEENRAAVRGVLKDTEELAEMVKAMDTLMNQQGEAMDVAAERLDTSAAKVDDSLQELRGAVGHSYGSMGTYFGFAGAALVGGGAAIAGAALLPAAGVGLAGAYAGRYVGKKLSKSAVQNATTHIDEHVANRPSR